MAFSMQESGPGSRVTDVVKCRLGQHDVKTTLEQFQALDKAGALTRNVGTGEFRSGIYVSASYSVASCGECLERAAPKRQMPVSHQLLWIIERRNVLLGKGFTLSQACSIAVTEEMNLADRALYPEFYDYLREERAGALKESPPSLAPVNKAP